MTYEVGTHISFDKKTTTSQKIKEHVKAHVYIPGTRVVFIMFKPNMESLKINSGFNQYAPM